MLNWGERGHVLAACDDEVVYCRVVGVMNMGNSAPFEAFARKQREHGSREFILDFSECEALDSTFLGILLGLRLGRGGSVDSRPRVTAINVTPQVRSTFAEVGIDRLIEILPRAVALPQIPMPRLERECSEGERLEMVLGAHEVLCEVVEGNRDRFGEFVRLLRSELARRSGAARRRAAATEGTDG